MTSKKWSSPLSIMLTSVIIKVLFVLLTVSLFAVPFIAGYFKFIVLFSDLYIPFLVTFYLCAVFAYAALYFLNKIIINIRNRMIFIIDNVKYMRVLSWCCYLVAAATFVFGFRMFYFFIIAAAAAFFGLILRVLKNVFEEAVIIREENDFTI